MMSKMDDELRGGIPSSSFIIHRSSLSHSVLLPLNFLPCPESHVRELALVSGNQARQVLRIGEKLLIQISEYVCTRQFFLHKRPPLHCISRRHIPRKLRGRPPENMSKDRGSDRFQSVDGVGRAVSG